MNLSLCQISWHLKKAWTPWAHDIVSLPIPVLNMHIQIRKQQHLEKNSICPLPIMPTLILLRGKTCMRFSLPYLSRLLNQTVMVYKFHTAQHTYFIDACRYEQELLI